VVSRAIRLFTELIAAGLLLAVAAALFLGWLAEEVLEGDTAQFDAYVRAAVHSYASPAFTSAMRFFTDVGSVYVMPILVAVTLLAFWLYRWRRAAVILAITLLGALVLEVALKDGFHRSRPTPYFGITAPHSFSFPSGHALFSFAFFGTLAALSSARVRRRTVRVAIWAAAVLMILLIGFSRIYLGVHYPTDVIAGYLTAFIWVSAVAHGDRYFRNRERKTPGRPDTLTPPAQ
jgi:undecaprenyl-diphosphatase